MAEFKLFCSTAATRTVNYSRLTIMDGLAGWNQAQPFMFGSG
jgi:hypothetical protein